MSDDEESARVKRDTISRPHDSINLCFDKLSDACLHESRVP